MHNAQKCPANTLPRITVADGVLTLAANPLRADIAAFAAACGQLAGSQAGTAILDLTRCTYLSSQYIGVLVDTVTQMKMDGREVVVRVSPELGRFLHMAHLYHIFAYEIADQPADVAK
jgi:anti-anti-sigma factor